MVESLIEQLPKIVAEGKKEVERIKERLHWLKHLINIYEHNYSVTRLTLMPIIIGEF